MSLLHRIAALVSFSTLLAAPALAGNGNGAPGSAAAHHEHCEWSHAHYEYDPVRSLAFAFEDIDARVNRKGELVVRYHVQPESFHFANQSGITPVLQVVAGNQLFRTPIFKKNGVVKFRLDRRADPRRVVISVTGANGRYRIDSVALQGRHAPRLALVVDDRRPDRNRYSDRGRGRGNRGNRS